MERKGEKESGGEKGNDTERELGREGKGRREGEGEKEISVSFLIRPLILSDQDPPHDFI